jgi:hypothetical protein
VHRGKHQDVDANLGLLRVLPLDLPVGSEEGNNIDDDESDGNDRPAATLHIFVTQGNQHGATSLARSQGTVLFSLGAGTLTKMVIHGAYRNK